jgi:hypothetical protein
MSFAIVDLISMASRTYFFRASAELPPKTHEAFTGRFGTICELRAEELLGALRWTFDLRRTLPDSLPSPPAEWLRSI